MVTFKAKLFDGAPEFRLRGLLVEAVILPHKPDPDAIDSPTSDLSGVERASRAVNWVPFKGLDLATQPAPRAGVAARL